MTVENYARKRAPGIMENRILEHPFFLAAFLEKALVGFG